MRKLTIILFAVLVYSTLFSQDTEWETQNYIGINAGGSLTSIFLIYQDSDSSLGFSNPYLNSYTGGLSFKSFSEGFIGISVDINYVRKGGYSEFTYDDTLAVTSAVLFTYIPSYIELKPLMNIRTGKKRSHINIYAGPHISWLIKDEIEFSPDAEISGHTYKQTADSKFEFGLNGGLGYSFDFKKSSVELRFLYSHALTTVFEAETSHIDQWFIQNQVMSASLVYYYKL